jgi:Phosphoglyceromutase
METRKSVLFLMNGFGMEVPRTLNVYSAALMPSLAKLSNHYPFIGVFASGTEVGLNKGQLSSFKAGYLSFSSVGKPNKKSNVVGAKIKEASFELNQVIVSSISHAVANSSRLHVMISIGERTEEAQFEQLKHYCLLATNAGVKDICVHVFLGDNSVRDMKVSALWLNNLKYHVMTFVPTMRLVSIAGRKYLTDAKKEDKINYYRMIVSGVGEIWANYSETLEKKYAAKSTDDNMGGFLTVRENVLRPNDSVMLFNYDNSIGAEYLDIVQNPTQFFPVGKVPTNVLVNSLFDIVDNPNVPYAFESELPQHYFLENIPDDKRVLIIADQDRVEYISKCLNGFREQFKPNVSVWPITDKKQRFDLLAQYLGAYISQDSYDLIIADCEMYNEQLEEKTVDQLKKNMALMDRCLNVAYTKSIEKGYTLYCGSLYGIKTQLLLTKTYENIDFSQKTPFMIAGQDIIKTQTALQMDGNFTQIAQILQTNMGVKVKSTLVTVKGAGKTNKKMNLIIIVVIAIFAIFILYVFMYTQGII